MSAEGRAALVLALLLGGGPPVAAQQVHREIGLQGYVLRGDADRAGGGAWVAWRAGPRGRISLFGGADRGEGTTTGRGELLAHLLVSPGRRQGAAPYLAGGLGVDVAGRSEARLVVLLGIEGAPGGREGWVLEAGVGGGWRVAAGWRWRR